MKSRISLKESVKNTKRKFGSTDSYYPVMVSEYSEAFPALFTKHEIDKAIKRARENPEDCPVKGFWYGWNLPK